MSAVVIEKLKGEKRMIPDVKCMFCEKNVAISRCVLIGKKQICRQCLDRLYRMLEFGQGKMGEMP
jgi:formylmethanofuran dehydrogenase subunit E